MVRPQTLTLAALTFLAATGAQAAVSMQLRYHAGPVTLTSQDGSRGGAVAAFGSEVATVTGKGRMRVLGKGIINIPSGVRYRLLGKEYAAEVNGTSLTIYGRGHVTLVFEDREATIGLIRDQSGSMFFEARGVGTVELRGTGFFRTTDLTISTGQENLDENQPVPSSDGR